MVVTDVRSAVTPSIIPPSIPTALPWSGPDVTKRDFTKVSASIGQLGYLSDDLTVALNLARAARNPSLEELYNLGPHPGNVAFEIGNPTLDTEVAYGPPTSSSCSHTQGQAEVTTSPLSEDVSGNPVASAAKLTRR
jgi:hypothetical protein